MSEWPPPDNSAVYLPPPLANPERSDADVKAATAAARLREGLTISDAILTELLAETQASGHNEVYTAAEKQDIDHDYERVERARAVLADAGDVFSQLALGWRDGRRVVRVWLTGEHDRYRRLLAEAIGPDRVVIESASLIERELEERQEQVWAQRGELAAQGIELTLGGSWLDGYRIDFVAPDPGRAERILHERFGEFATIHNRGATLRTIRLFPFGSWLAEEDRLHVFYGLPHNGERPVGCQAAEHDGMVLVALTILDWNGAKTLIGGFKPSHATVQLDRPLGDRAVIDVAENRARPHWSLAGAPPARGLSR